MADSSPQRLSFHCRCHGVVETKTEILSNPPSFTVSAPFDAPVDVILRSVVNFAIAPVPNHIRHASLNTTSNLLCTVALAITYDLNLIFIHCGRLRESAASVPIFFVDALEGQLSSRSTHAGHVFSVLSGMLK
ncbi:hypothetical protein ABKN59_010041 [Abortiporus biennis]